MKLFGAVAVLITCTLIGFEWSKKFSRRVEQLRYYRHCLQLLEAEMVYNQAPLYMISTRISKEMKEPFASFFKKLASALANGVESTKVAWEEALYSISGQLDLKEEEMEILKRFGATLGQHDREQQQKQLALAYLQLENQEKEAYKDQLRFEAMTKRLGFLLGLLLVILLL